MKTITLTTAKRRALERRRHNAERRIYQRLSAVLWSAEGRPRQEVADLLGVSVRQVSNWLRIFRHQGVETLCTLGYQGDQGNLQPEAIERLKKEIAKGVFHNSSQIRHWMLEKLGVEYSNSGVKDLLKRLGITYHKVSGFFWKADRKKQRQFVQKYRRHKRQACAKTLRFFVDACHPIWGLELIDSCWLWRSQRFPVGIGNGRKRLNILGAYHPGTHEYIDIRVTKENINGEQFILLLEKIHARHPEATKIILYLDNAKYYTKPIVQAGLAKHRQFQLVHLPPYSPNLNLIERLWKFLRKQALQRWHKTFEDMQKAIANVLDNLNTYKAELHTLITEKFHILRDHEVPIVSAA